MTDDRARTIAKEFCTHRSGIDERTWPCQQCLARGRNAVAALDNVPRLFDPGRLHVDPVLVPLEDMGAPASHAGGTDTENAAKWALAPKVGTQRELILQAFVRDEQRRGVTLAGGEQFTRQPQGWTDDELAMHVHPSAARRRVELYHGGWLRDTGQRRQTRAGSSAIVWRLTAAALNRLAEPVAADA